MRVSLVNGCMCIGLWTVGGGVQFFIYRKFCHSETSVGGQSSTHIIPILPRLCKRFVKQNGPVYRMHKFTFKDLPMQH